MTKDKVIIAPSILSADFASLGDEIKDIESGGCDWVHVDVMDGHFVPNLTIGAPVVKSLRKVTNLPLDVHLMIDEPIKYAEDFAKAGADYLTVHVEATENVMETLHQIKELGMKPGISLRPNTSLEMIKPYLAEVDLVLVMTVEPGFGGQSFKEDMMEKVSELKEIFSGYISVDGGINQETAEVARGAGANVLVAGTAVFGKDDRAGAIQQLRGSSVKESI